MACGEAGGKTTPVQPGDITTQTSAVVSAIQTGPTTNPQPSDKDFLVELSLGNLTDYSKVNKFGRNPAVGGTYEVVSISGLYQTPTAAASLEFVSSNSADALNGAGMRSLTIVGLDANWAEQTVTMAAHATDGTVAVAITGTWLRVYRAYVASSGTYATSAAGSHVGTITIRAAGAGATWITIDSTGFPRGQTETAAYTIPLGKTAVLLEARVSVSGITTTKTTNVIFFQRPLANDVTTPYTGVMREVTSFTGLTNGLYVRHTSPPLGPFVGPCDLGFMAVVSSGSGEVEAEFDLILVDT